MKRFYPEWNPSFGLPLEKRGRGGSQIVYEKG